MDNDNSNADIAGRGYYLLALSRHYSDAGGAQGCCLADWEGTGSRGGHERLRDDLETFDVDAGLLSG